MVLQTFFFFAGESNIAAKQSSSQFGDVPFGIPGPSSGGRGGASAEGGGGATLEEEQLIRMGQLTPFGTRVDILPDSGDSGTSGLVGVPAESASIEEESNSSRPVKPPRQARSRIPKKPGATPAKNHSDDVTLSQSPSGSLEPNSEIGFDPDDWLPSLADLLESASASSGDSEYLTDDELGTAKKKKKKLRDLSSDGLSDEEEPRRKGRRKGKRKMKAGTQRGYHGDDGDEELYQQRLW